MPGPLLLGGTDGSSNAMYLMSNDGNYTVAATIVSSRVVSAYETTAIFRDPAAWYHIVFAFDTTQAAGIDRLKIYVNGVLQAVTLSSGTYISLNSPIYVNGGIGINNRPTGSTPTAGFYGDGLLAEYYYIDGYQLDASSFGRVDPAWGTWVATPFSGTYGARGCYLPFSDASSTTTLGYDASGNTNNWTLNNISLTPGTTYDSMYDVPLGAGSSVGNGLGNYATLNPLINTATYLTLSNSNLTATVGAADKVAFATIPVPSSGMWYWEQTITNVGLQNASGVFDASVTQSSGTGFSTNIQRTYMINGQKYNGASSLFGAAISTGDIVGVAVDMDNGTMYFSRNGVWQNSGVPTSGTTATGAAFTDMKSSGYNWYPAAYINSGAATLNFGQQPFAYTPPAGYKALHTGNLPTPVITQPNKYFDTTLYTGSHYTSTLPFTPLKNSPSANTVLLLHGDGIDGSTTIVDSSSFAHAITPSGNTRVSATQSKFGSSSIHFDGTGYLTSPSSIDYALGTIWTIEFWAYPTSYSAIIIDVRSSNTSGYVYLNASGNITVPTGPYSPPSGTLASTIPLPLNSWSFVAISADSAGTSIFINGTLAAQQTNPTFSSNWATTPQTLFVGASFSADTNYNGYIDDLRITNGLNRYTPGNVVPNISAFTPDLVWIKSRSAATDHKLVDSVRGVTNAISSNTATIQSTDTQGLLSFNTGGFTLGTDTSYNNTGASYVAWQWKKGATPGFDIVSYTGNGSGSITTAHSLGIAPSMIISKSTSLTSDWMVYHISLGETKAVWLDLINSAGTSISYWNNTAPTSSNFTVAANNNHAGETVVNYLFAAIPGFSSFGSYIGNGNVDGPFINCGFTPKYFLLKSTGITNAWFEYDSVRNTLNPANKWLSPTVSNIESTNVFGDFMSSGVKLRDTNTAWNSTGEVYIYAAFADTPFKYSLAR